MSGKKIYLVLVIDRPDNNGYILKKSDSPFEID